MRLFLNERLYAQSEEALYPQIQTVNYPFALDADMPLSDGVAVLSVGRGLRLIHV